MLREQVLSTIGRPRSPSGTAPFPTLDWSVSEGRAKAEVSLLVSAARPVLVNVATLADSVRLAAPRTVDWSAVIEDHPAAVVEFVLDVEEVLWRVSTKSGAFREVVAEEAVPA